MRWNLARLAALAMGALTLLGGNAAADGQMATRTLTQADKARLAQYDTVSRAAILGARDHGAAADIRQANRALAGAPRTILGDDLLGLYRCRTIKMGGNLPLTVYGWFTCKIDLDGLGYRLVKTSGSQRFTGHFIDESEKRLIYYGATHTISERPVSYGWDKDRDQVGYFFKTGPRSYRLELPLPRFESKFDVIELERK
ncbi:MAG: hypothetical protein ABS35_34400 [Kaistia sp. SCN 65-12]|mgnify:CR=1 FL=1|nr:MAG: hypothetical protein ABS35_34400 [Kaistia sp. SCN 65-12]